MPERSPKGQGQAATGVELLVERKIFGATQRVTVIDPQSGAEASASGPLRPGIEQSLIDIAVKKLRRGITI